jgi:probable HAF family extracellular repeat protein
MAYTYTNIINPGDPTFNQALGINNGGVISGYFGSGAAGHPNQGYITTTTNLTAFTPENFPGSAQTQVTGLNNRGATVGFYSGTNLGVGLDANYGFWTKNAHVFTSVQDPFTPPATTALPTNQLLGINDSGIAVGFYVDAKGNSHGYEFNTNTSKFSAPINVPGATSTTTTAIDNAGDLAGFYTNGAGKTVGFVDIGGSFTTLNVPKATAIQAFGINNNGQVVGNTTIANGNTFGFLYTISSGTFQFFSDPLGRGTTIFNGINDAADIVGFYTNAKGNTIGLLATPGPTAPSVAETGATAQSFDAYSLLAPDVGVHTGLHYENSGRGYEGLTVAAASVGHQG